jgi:hydroxymethylglutaryl-CoA lyase
MKLPKKIRIREVGPREGFQIIPKIFKTEEKARLIELLADSGLKEIEIASFVRPDKVPQMADAEILSRLVKKKNGVKYTALYLNPEGFRRAEQTGNLDNEAWINAACSDTFLAKNSNTSLDKIIDSLPQWISTFSDVKKPLHGLMLSTAFGCSYEGEISEDKVIRVISKITTALSKEGVVIKELCLADTVGLANPLSVEKAILAVSNTFPSLYISIHLHNTRGLGIANALTALQLGIDCFDSSIGGVGGCPFTKGASGNIATEELVYLCTQLKIESGVNLEKLKIAATYISSTLGIDLNSSMKLAS